MQGMRLPAGATLLAIIMVPIGLASLWASYGPARVAEFTSFGLPLLVGASRKRFIDKVSPAAPDQRLGGSIAAHLLAAAGGAAIIRTHDVPETVQALRIAAAIRGAR